MKYHMIPLAALITGIVPAVAQAAEVNVYSYRDAAPAIGYRWPSRIGTLARGSRSPIVLLFDRLLWVGRSRPGQTATGQKRTLSRVS